VYKIVHDVSIVSCQRVMMDQIILDVDQSQNQVLLNQVKLLKLGKSCKSKQYQGYLSALVFLLCDCFIFIIMLFAHVHRQHIGENYSDGR
jgi:hypothetical protein